jgi:hypothetical protein
LQFVAPTPETEGLTDLLRGRDDVRCARTAARQLVDRGLDPDQAIMFVLDGGKAVR